MAIDVRTRKGLRLPNVSLAGVSDIHSTGNVLAISVRFIVYTDLSHVVCIE